METQYLVEFARGNSRIVAESDLPKLAQDVIEVRAILSKGDMSRAAGQLEWEREQVK